MIVITRSALVFLVLRLNPPKKLWLFFIKAIQSCMQIRSRMCVARFLRYNIIFCTERTKGYFESLTRVVSISGSKQACE